MRTIALAVTFACALSGSAFANPLTLSTPGVVGTLDGKIGNSNPSTELTIAQYILDLVGLGVVSPIAPTQFYKTSTVFDYSGTLSNPIQRSGVVVPFGYLYALAKYDGPNGGYVLFNLPTVASNPHAFASNTLPEYPANFWTTNAQKYGISHFTTFDTLSVPVPASVPDGGSTVALLGSALFAVGFLRHRFSSATAASL